MSMKYRFHCDWCDMPKPENAIGWDNIQFGVNYEMEGYDICPECKEKYMPPSETQGEDLQKKGMKVMGVAESTVIRSPRIRMYQGLLNALLAKHQEKEAAQESEIIEETEEPKQPETPIEDAKYEEVENNEQN